MGGSSGRQTFEYTTPIPDSARPGESPIYRCAGSSPDLHSPHPLGATTIYEGMKAATVRFARRNCFGTREQRPNGELGDYHFKTFEQVWDIVNRLADAILPLVPRNEEGMAFVGLYSKNREEWVISDLACSAQDITVIPLYDTLGADNMEFIVGQTQLTCVAASSQQKAALYKLHKQGKLPSLKTIIQFEPVTDEERKEAGDNELTLLDYNELIRTSSGKGEKHPPTPDSVYTICYTSGTTGQSKGAVITHRAMIETVSAVSQKFDFAETDCHLSYLPLAHMMERICMNVLLVCGTSVGFFGGNILKVKEDLAALRPTIFVSVPRLFSRFYDAINGQFKATSGISKRLVDRALRVKSDYYKNLGTTNSRLWDALVFRKVRNSIGGRVRIMITGSAPISADVLSFLKICFSCPIVEGFGQTESCAASIVTDPQDPECGFVGGPLPCVEVKLVAVPEMRYHETDTDEQGRPTPRGELCMRGPALFSGYYKQPDKTAEALDSEGWLHTGDIVMRLAHNGAIKIIDRKKNIFKLSQGEYVAVEKIENAYNESPFINQIFVYGDSLKAYLIGIVVPEEMFVRKHWYEANGVSAETPFAEVCKNEKFKKDVLEDMNALAKKKGLLGFEKVVRIHLEPKMWTPDDLLTPTQKLKRFEAKEYYQTVIEQLYSEGGD